MREIKFRAYDTLTKQMDNSFIIYSDGRTFIDSGWDEIHVGQQVNERYKVMQYSGLKDKNKKEIYEGDILKTTQDRKAYKECVWIVFFNQENCCYELKNLTLNFNPFLWSEIRDSNGNCCCEIIGNIYENLELIGRKDS